ncbi:alpha/beta fold hydrolase [uncultured Sulfitobacter sp.]|uniref:alpha/beta fold hydrolase n=1 Tax=uncultured Sulfitobacter sp. TaxID=191468 RepID=UPI002639E265|nr:alpha/beta fold hydrolase [uncultured Sulfitobacter sp.]
MPLLRINATVNGPALHASTRSIRNVLVQARNGRGVSVIMVHGYKYSPFVTGRCPHRQIFAAEEWPAALGLAQPDTLSLAFGWHARGGLAVACAAAYDAARDLAEVIAALRKRGPVQVIAHSLGATVALAALPYLQSGDVGRMVLLSGAAHIGLARHALATPAGRSCHLVHVTSHENALFDLVFERLVSGSGAIGRGIAMPNAHQVQIDCTTTLKCLATLGFPLAPPQRRICHWSSYTRHGVMAFNGALLTGQLPLTRLLTALKDAPPAPSVPCPAREKTHHANKAPTERATA